MSGTAFISREARRNFLKVNKKCCICGNPATTVDHVIPCHVFDMTMPTEGLYRLAVQDRSNWQPACKKCNTNKSAYIDKSKLPTHLYLKYKDSVDTYTNAMHDYLEEHDYKCAACGTPITETTGILKFKRSYLGNKVTKDTVVCVCRNCYNNTKN